MLRFNTLFAINCYLKRCMSVVSTQEAPVLDLNYLCNPANTEEIANNITARKAAGNIKYALELKAQLESCNSSDESYGTLYKQFYRELLKIPNKTHPAIVNLKEEPRVLHYSGEKKTFNYKCREFHEIANRLNLIRTSQLGNVCGNRSYILLGELAELEQALISYTVARLIEKNYKLVSVPDILNRSIIEGCGLSSRGDHTQIYTLEPDRHGSDLCLSGTSEMALAALFQNKIFKEQELPIKLAAVSRCYRAEISATSEQRGIYRVHQFTKVEMFAVTTPETSDEMLEEFRKIEENNFGDLGLYMQILDMPPHELGAPAYRKYDIEAWMPGRQLFGEISSCSNCTDYQSRRLNIKYTSHKDLGYVHTINGTACAVPRMLIALSETFQNDKGYFTVPDVLQRYMRGKKQIGRQRKLPELKLIKHK